MSDRIYIGNMAAALETAPAVTPYTRVVLWRDRETSFVAGDETGQTLELSLRWATQAVADDMLAKLSGMKLTPFSARHAVMDPAVELGDAVTIGGIYSQLDSITVNYDAELSASLEAPFEDEFQDEYPYYAFNQKVLGQIASVRSSITKTAEQIRLTVEGINGEISSLTQTVNRFESRIEDAEGNMSTLSQTVNGFDVRVKDVETGLSQTISMSADGILISNEDGSELEIDGGQLMAESVLVDSIRLYDQMSIYTEDDEASDGFRRVGFFGYYSGSDGVNDTDGVGIRASGISSGRLFCTNAGMWCGYSYYSGISAYELGVTIVGETITIDGTMEDTNGSVITSDRRTKTDISYAMGKRLEVLYSLKPCTYRRTEGQRLHSGLIAQEVEAARDAAGIASNDYAALCINAKGNYGIRYIEFVPDLIAAVQNLNERIRALEGIA